MAVQSNSIELPTELSKLSKRELTWLAEAIAKRVGLFEKFHATDTRGYESHHSKFIARYLSTSNPSKPTVEAVLDEKARQLVPDQEIKWIDQNDQRLLIWVQLQIDQMLFKSELRNLRPILEKTHFEHRYERSMLALDLAPFDIEEKRNFISQLKSLWAEQKLPPSKTNWINPKDKQQIERIYKYLFSHRQELPIPKPVNHQEKVAYVLAALDQTSLLEPSAQELFMLKLKRTWSQYKYRHTGEAKKQVYMPLGEEARALLDELAERADTPRYKVVEQLVREAHAKINDN